LDALLKREEQEKWGRKQPNMGGVAWMSCSLHIYGPVNACVTWQARTNVVVRVSMGHGFPNKIAARLSRQD
jgi:hypothetical protein